MKVLATVGNKGGKSKWKNADNYHVTQLFIGGSNIKKDNPIFKNYILDQQVEFAV